MRGGRNSGAKTKKTILGKAPMEVEQASIGELMQTQPVRGEERRRICTPPIVKYSRPVATPSKLARGGTGMVRDADMTEAEVTANTRWGMWTAAEGSKKDVSVTHASLTAIMEESGRENGKGNQSEGSIGFRKESVDAIE